MATIAPLLGASMGRDGLRPVEERVLLVPPTRRDGEVTCDLLRRDGVHCVVCPDLTALAAQLKDGVGAVLLTDSALADPRIEALLDTLSHQPPWSDVPVVLLMRNPEHTPATARALRGLTNVTLLDRPVSKRSMSSAVLSALRARRRQYQIREQMNEQLQAEAALRDADRRKDEFLATLAHELRNPLAPIRTGLQVLARTGGDTGNAAHTRSMMDRQLGLLVKLIDELLDVSRISTGKVNLQRQRVDMRTVVEAALEGSQPLLDAERHVLNLELPADPLWTLGDPSRLAQVVGNLVNNAAKYTPSGGHIRVSLVEEGGDAVVHVSDDGAGVPEHMLDHVFDMFTQVNRTLDRAQGGLGIGLSLVRRLMELHGGSATAQSAGLGHGSTFSVRLPALAGELPIAAENSARAVRPSRRVRVLIVDDNTDAADTLAMLLAVDGHETRAAYSGDAALRAAQEFRPDAVFCDIGLPGMNGHEVAARLRADRRHTPALLVAVTGWGSEKDKRRALDAGFDFHLTKPIGAEAVDEILARL